MFFVDLKNQYLSMDYILVDSLKYLRATMVNHLTSLNCFLAPPSY